MRNQHHTVTEFLTAEKVPPIDINRRMKVVFGGDWVDISTVRHWTARVRDPYMGHAKQRSGRPWTATDEVHRNRVDEMLKDNHRVSQQAIVKRIIVLCARVERLNADLRYRKLCAQWIPRMLTEEPKQKQKDTCRQSLLRCEHKGDEFLCNTVTRDESSAHHFEPESKRHSIEYRHKASPASRPHVLLTKSCSMLSGMLSGSVLLCSVVYTIEMKWNTINSESYVRTMQKLKARRFFSNTTMRGLILAHKRLQRFTSLVHPQTECHAVVTRDPLHMF